jgi:hydroxypyruvate reductase
LSAGSDGLDGPTDAAGALVDGRTMQAGRETGLAAAAYLENNDSYSFFSELDLRAGVASHVKTGPTGTNVMDIQVILLGGMAPAGREAEA